MRKRNKGDVELYFDGDFYCANAEWVNHNPKKPTKEFHCSNCLGFVEISHYAYDCYYKYCPNCGAKMDKEKKHG